MEKKGFNFGKRLITIKDAFSKINTEPKIIHPILCCSICSAGELPEFHHVPVYEKAFTNLLKNNIDWFFDQLCYGYCRLVFHFYHPKGMVFVDCPVNVVDIEMERTYRFNREVNDILLTCLKEGQFALLIINIVSKKVFIFDGLELNKKQWSDNIFYQLKITSQIKLDATAQKTLIYSDKQFPYKASEVGMSLQNRYEVTFHPDNEKQKDSYNCGPIMCSLFSKIVSSNQFKVPDAHQQAKEECD